MDKTSKEKNLSDYESLLDELHRWVYLGKTIIPPLCWRYKEEGLDNESVKRRVRHEMWRHFTPTIINNAIPIEFLNAKEISIRERKEAENVRMIKRLEKKTEKKCKRKECKRLSEETKEKYK